MNLELFIVRRLSTYGGKSPSGFFLRIATAAVALSVACMIISSALINGFQTEIRNKVFGFWAHIQILPYSLSQSLLEEGIYRYPEWRKGPMPEGVKHLQVSALKGGLLRHKDGFEGVVIKGAGNDFWREAFLPYLKAGQLPKWGDSSALKSIVLSSSTCRRLQIDTGDKLIVNFIGKDIRSRAFRVAGIYETGVEEFDRRHALTDIAIIQQLNGWGPDTVGGFEIFAEPQYVFRGSGFDLRQIAGLQQEKEHGLDALVDKLYRTLAGANLDIRTVRDLHPGIFDWLELQNMNEGIILILMMVVAVMNMITALLILILDRTEMVGIMKALGASNARLRRIFVFYGLYITGWGLLWGNLAGLGLCWLQHQFRIITLPQESYYLSYAPIELSVWMVLGINLACIIVCFLSFQLPALLVRRISPVKAIRFS